MAFSLMCALIILLSGCASGENAPIVFSEPEITVQSLEISDLSFDKVGITAVIEVYNPSPFNLAFSGLRYSVESEGRQFLSGNIGKSGTSQNRSVPVQLTAKNRTELSIPLIVETKALINLLSADDSRSVIPYTLAVDLTTVVPVISRTITVSAERTGELPLPRIPKIGVQEVVISDFGNQKITFDIVFSLENPNIFGLSVGELAYLFSVNDEPWTEGGFGRTFLLPPGKEELIRLPMEFSYLTAGRTIVNILVAEKRLEYFLEGSVNIGILLQEKTLGPFPLRYNREGTATIVRPDRFGM